MTGRPEPRRWTLADYALFMAGNLAAFAAIWWRFLGSPYYSRERFDWLHHFLYVLLPQRSLVHHDVPFFWSLETLQRSHFLFANPEDISLSPLHPLLLCLDADTWIRLAIVTTFVVGSGFLAKVAAHWRAPSPFATLVGVVALTNGAILSHTYIGHVGFILYYLLPGVVYALWLKRAPCLAGFLIGGLYLVGAPHICIWIALATLMLDIWLLLNLRSYGGAAFLRRLKTEASAALWAVGFAAVKILPLSEQREFLQGKPTGPGFLSFSELWLHMAGAPTAIPAVRNSPQELTGGLWWWERYAYVGAPVAAVLIGAVLGALIIQVAGRRRWPAEVGGWAFAALTFLALSMFTVTRGLNALFSFVPVLTSQNLPTRFVLGFYLFACLTLLALGGLAWSRWRHPPALWRGLGALACLGAGAILALDYRAVLGQISPFEDGVRSAEVAATIPQKLALASPAGQLRFSFYADGAAIKPAIAAPQRFTLEGVDGRFAHDFLYLEDEDGARRDFTLAGEVELRPGDEVRLEFWSWTLLAGAVLSCLTWTAAAWSVARRRAAGRRVTRATAPAP